MANLRQQKVQRTRRELVATALELFTDRGFQGVTLDMLCDRVMVSKRTFFRYFTSKEDVAMAPLQDLWSAYLVRLRAVEPDGRSLFDSAGGALLQALRDVVTDGWVPQTLLSCRLAELTPSVNAHHLQFCERTAQAASDVLFERFELDHSDALRVRLVSDMLLAAFRRALSMWVDQETGPTSPQPDLAQLFQTALEALSGSMELTAGRRVTPAAAGSVCSPGHLPEVPAHDLLRTKS